MFRNQTDHHFHPRLIFLPFGCVSKGKPEMIGLSIPWQSKVSSKCLVSKIHLILLQNIVGIVKNAQGKKAEFEAGSPAFRQNRGKSEPNIQDH